MTSLLFFVVSTRHLNNYPFNSGKVTPIVSIVCLVQGLSALNSSVLVGGAYYLYVYHYNIV